MLKIKLEKIFKMENAFRPFLLSPGPTPLPLPSFLFRAGRPSLSALGHQPEPAPRQAAPRLSLRAGPAPSRQPSCPLTGSSSSSHRRLAMKLELSTMTSTQSCCSRLCCPRSTPVEDRATGAEDPFSFPAVFS